MEDDETKVDSSVEDIARFTEDSGIKIAPVRVKLLEYLSIKDSRHYDALERGNIVK